MHRLTMKFGWGSASALLTMALLSGGCPTEEDPTPGAESGEETSALTTTIGDTTGAATPPATGDSTDEGTTVVDPTGDAETSESDTDAETEGTTEGVEACEIMLPPPMACAQEGSIGPNYLDYDRTAPGMGVATDVVDPSEPELGGGTFIDDPDGGPVQFECSIFEQDCPAGEKCMPWANDGGGSWNATRCSPIADSPDQAGDQCTVEGSGVSGIDSCDQGLMCWDVDPETNQGTCIEMCSCSELNPVCNTANTVCSISNDGVLALCLPVCNPLDPAACGEGEGCYAAGDFFQCAPDASGGAGAGEECAFVNGCAVGSACLNASSVPGCTGPFCCSDLCNPADGDAGCIEGQSCLPWYDAGAAPDECLGEVGVCAVAE
ncbi:MAG: hypothetical protein AAF799_47075 [Myxococcota bacterium]